MRRARVTFLLLAFLALGCSTEPSRGDCGRGRARCIDGGAPIDAGAAPPTTDGGGRDASCALLESDPVDARVPVDILVVMDSTGSTGMVPARVQREIDASLRPTLERAGLDYRVVLFASCRFDLTGVPADRYARYPIGLGSGDLLAFRPLLDSYITRPWDTLTSSEQNDLVPCTGADGRRQGWRSLLRPEATKVILHFTDSAGDGARIEGHPGTFDQALLALDPAMFGTPDEPRFVYHSFAGFSARAIEPDASPFGALWCPEDEIVGTTCSGPFAGTPGAGPGFQQVARTTGGIRASVCDFERYPQAFTRIAEQTIASSQNCTFDVPPAPEGLELDLAAIAIRWTSSRGATTDLRRVASAEACGDEYAFVVDETSTPPRIDLCPRACRLARLGLCDDPVGALRVRFLCERVPF